MIAIAYRPLYEQPPTCLGWLEHSHCVLTEGHDSTCLPPPDRYVPDGPKLEDDEEVTA